MKRSIFAILICCCVLGLTRRAFAFECPFDAGFDVSYYTTAAAALAACQADRAVNLPATSCYNTSQQGSWYTYGYSATSGGEVIAFFAWPAGCACLDSNSDANCDLADADGDGIPDGSDPCPTDQDCDDDGKPDKDDPCPQNPNPNCTDPDNPGPDIPGDIIIGDCTVDITSLKAWLLSEDSFPFNILYRVYSIASVFFNAEPAAPVFEFDIPMDPNGSNSWVPDLQHVKIDLAPFNSIAYILRIGESLLIAWGFALYGKRRLQSFSGASVD